MKHKPIYREVLKKAWQLTWRHKRLWLFGFFATFLQTSGVVELVSRGFYRIPAAGWDIGSIVQSAYPGAAFVGAFALFRDNQSHLTLTGATIIFITIAALIAFLWFISTSAGSLIWSVGKNRTIPSLEKGFRGAQSSGWRIVGLVVLSKLVLAALFLLISLPLLLALQHTTWNTMMLYIVLFLIFFPLLLIVSFMTIYAMCAVVLDTQHFFKAIETSWYLFRKHWIISLETSVILFGAGVLGAIVITIIAWLISIPFVLLLSVAVLTGSKILFTSVAITSLLLIVVLILLIGTIVTTFQITTWTLLYGRLRRGAAIPKLVRFLRAVPKFFLHRKA